MPEVQRSALLPYSCEDVYDLVNDIDAYPRFLPWCDGVEVKQRDDQGLQARILIKMAGVEQWFETRNSMEPGRRIDMTLVDGPFESLDGVWRFEPLGGQGCKIDLSLSYEIRRGMAMMLLKPAFNRIANTLVDSFCQRAHQTYGAETAD